MLLLTCKMLCDVGPDGVLESLIEHLTSQKLHFIYQQGGTCKRQIYLIKKLVQQNYIQLNINTTVQNPETHFCKNLQYTHDWPICQEINLPWELFPYKPLIFAQHCYCNFFVIYLLIYLLIYFTIYYITSSFK